MKLHSWAQRFLCLHGTCADKGARQSARRATEGDGKKNDSNNDRREAGWNPTDLRTDQRELYARQLPNLIENVQELDRRPHRLAHLPDQQPNEGGNGDGTLRIFLYSGLHVAFNCGKLVLRIGG
jgi:hypothetical protein